MLCGFAGGGKGMRSKCRQHADVARARFGDLKDLRLRERKLGNTRARHGVAKASGDVGSAASQVLGSASALSERAERLRHDVETFLATVRAA
jgi:hypothetical protein